MRQLPHRGIQSCCLFLKICGRAKQSVEGLVSADLSVFGAVSSGDLRRVGNLYDPPPGYKDDLIVWDFIWTRISSWDARAALVSSAPNLEKQANNSECRKGCSVSVTHIRIRVTGCRVSATGNLCHPVGGSSCLFLKIRYIAGTDNCKRQSPHEAVSKVCNSLLSHLELLLVSHNSIPPAQWELVTLRTFRRGGRMQDLPDGICCQQRRAP